jgi:rod shape-determining protein MreB
MWKKLTDLFSNDIGIDLGTANTLVFVKGAKGPTGTGIVLREPSVVAKIKSTGALIVGEEAKRMIGRTPDDITTIRPMRSGVIADFETCEEMIRYFIRNAIKLAHKHRKFRKPRIIIAVPFDITEVERRAVIDSAMNAGAREVKLIHEPMAAAIGVGLPVDQPTANMIVDIGGGTTEVALISLNGIVYAESVRVGGDAMDDNIIQYMRRMHRLQIGARTAEEIKITIGSAYPMKQELAKTVKGRDAIDGMPKSIPINSSEIREALRESVSQIVIAVHKCFEKAPEELSGDLVRNGLVLSGGGSLLMGLDQLLSEETGLPVFRAENALTAVADGTGKVLNDFDRYVDSDTSRRR